MIGGTLGYLSHKAGLTYGDHTLKTILGHKSYTAHLEGIITHTMLQINSTH